MKDLGLDPASKQARKMIDRVDKRLVFKRLNNRPFLYGETEPCINGRILGIGSYFKEPNDALAKQLLSEQLADGGWNCEAPKSRRSSFHTTICVLEGLLDYERAGRKSAAVTKARKRAENYLLERRMFRSLRTGEVINKRWLRFSFPTFWHYDVLRGLDYLRNAGIKPDSRVRDAIEIVMRAPPPERALAAQPASSGTYSFGDGDRGRQGKPLEYAARSPSPALERQLDGVVHGAGRHGSTRMAECPGPLACTVPRRNTLSCKCAPKFIRPMPSRNTAKIAAARLLAFDILRKVEAGRLCFRPAADRTPRASTRATPGWRRRSSSACCATARSSIT